MPRQKNAVHAHIQSVGSLISVDGDLKMDAITDDNRRVFVGFNVGRYSVEAFGRNVATARQMRSLAETLMRHAERLENTPDKG